MTRQTDNQIVALWGDLADGLSGSASVIGSSPIGATDNAEVELGVVLTAASPARAATLGKPVFKKPV